MKTAKSITCEPISEPGREFSLPAKRPSRELAGKGEVRRTPSTAPYVSETFSYGFETSLAQLFAPSIQAPECHITVTRRGLCKPWPRRRAEWQRSRASFEELSFAD